MRDVKQAVGVFMFLLALPALLASYAWALVRLAMVAKSPQAPPAGFQPL